VRVSARAPDRVATLTPHNPAQMIPSAKNAELAKPRVCCRRAVPRCIRAQDQLTVGSKAPLPGTEVCVLSARNFAG
jgi:hypothetical protein